MEWVVWCRYCRDGGNWNFFQAGQQIRHSGIQGSARSWSIRGPRFAAELWHRIGDSSSTRTLPFGRESPS
jgi:hypothetical protein